MTIIRPATHADVGGMLVVGKRMWSETDHAILDLDLNRVEATFVDKIDQHFAMVVDHGGEVVGVITAFIDRFWYSQDPVSFLQMWYVVPEHRRGLLGGLMIRHYVRWSKRQGARAMYAYTTAGIRTEATDALLQHAGFTRIGGSYRKEA